jgi:hypothetical protein
MLLPPEVLKGGSVTVLAAAAGGDKDGGHSAVVLSDGRVLTCGCDRWQQLGLGSSSSGAAGYTWKDGRIWQPLLLRVPALSTDAYKATTFDNDPIIDVSCGADYTISQTRMGRVIGIGRSHLGQVTGNGKRGPFVTAAVNVVRNGGNNISHVVTKPDGDCTLLVRDLKSALAAQGGGGPDLWWDTLKTASAECNAPLQINGKCPQEFVLGALHKMAAAAP